MADDYRATIATMGAVAVVSSATGVIERRGDVGGFAVELVAGKIYVIDFEGIGAGTGTLDEAMRTGGSAHGCSPWVPPFLGGAAALVSGRTRGSQARLPLTDGTGPVHFRATGWCPFRSSDMLARRALRDSEGAVCRRGGAWSMAAGEKR